MTDGIDGIAGLAGDLVLTAILATFVFQMTSGIFVHMDKLLLLAVVIIPYMMSNLGFFGLRKIFLGDAGSMLIGYLLAWTQIILTQPNQPAIEPVYALWCVAIPLLDMWAVMFKRLCRGLSPFTADRGHLHHLFLSHGVGSRRALASIILLAITILAVGVLVRLLFPEIGFYVFLALLVAYTVANQYFDVTQPEQPALNQATNKAESVEFE